MEGPKHESDALIGLMYTKQCISLIHFLTWHYLIQSQVAGWEGMTKMSAIYINWLCTKQVKFFTILDRNSFNSQDRVQKKLRLTDTQQINQHVT